MINVIKTQTSTGFQMTFENGLTISVQIGYGNYCSNRSLSSMNSDVKSSPDAEIAIWDENNTWFNFGTDSVKGWVPTDEIAEWIFKVKSATSIQDIKQ